MSNTNNLNNAPNISDLPDQFNRYESKIYNKFDFYTSSGEFNLALFNKTFREEQLKRVAFYRQEEIDRLKKLDDKQPPPLRLHEESVGEHVLKIKDSVFGLINDSITEPISSEIFIKNNRLFYLAILFIMIFVIYLMISFLTRE